MNKQKTDVGKAKRGDTPPNQPPAGSRQNDKVEVTALPPEIAIKQIKDSVDHTVMWCTIILTVVGVIGTIAAVRTLRQVKRQADTLDDHRAKFEELATAAGNNAAAARDLVAAAEAQRNLMESAGRHTEALAAQAVKQTELTQAQLELSHRPWIAVDFAPSSPLIFDERGCVTTFKVTMRNVGHSVAKHVSLWTGFAISGVHDPMQVRDQLCSIMKQPQNENSDYGYLPFPNQQVVEERPVIGKPEDVKKALEMKIFQGLNAIGLHLVGCVDYPSAFDPKKHHQTRFVYVVGYADMKRGGIVMGAFDASTPRHFNIVLNPMGHGASAD